ncbi:hypothetical protein HZH68_000171 [Vespula germanica]|uniref:L27 domain-containing protein n=1 Tax=Vespula germanica TaxID=30212 RepID=A0A834NT67_VESGE|nr:hypothetical protein HZH68_000171 [Vespula germanica]
MVLIFSEAHRALELLEDYHAKLTRPQDKALRLAIERVIRIFKSRLFQALLATESNSNRDSDSNGSNNNDKNSNNNSSNSSSSSSSGSSVVNISGFLLGCSAIGSVYVVSTTKGIVAVISTTSYGASLSLSRSPSLGPSPSLSPTAIFSFLDEKYGVVVIVVVVW